MSAPSLLLERLPRLRDHVRPVALGDWPTPIERVTGVSECPSLYVKRDDLSAKLYGGSKVRNLEWIFGRAQIVERTAFLTVAAWGSHLVVGLAEHARVHGFSVHAALVPQPVTDEVEANLCRARAAGADLERLTHAIALPAALRRLARRAAERSPKGAFFVMPGAAQATGALGYAQAALEIRAAVERGEMPAPDFVHCAAGSCGTLTGLAEGFALAGLSPTIVAVRVVPRVAVLSPWIAYLRRRLRGVLVEYGAPADVEPIRVHLHHGAAGRGYGVASDAAHAAVREAAAAAGLHLETTYTGKAWSGMREFIRANGLEKRTHLFVQTFDGRGLWRRNGESGTMPS